MDFVIGQECRCCIHHKVCMAQNRIAQEYQQIKEALNDAKLGIHGPFKLVYICPEYINRNNLRKIERGEH